MSHYYNQPFAELYIDKKEGLLRCEFKNHDAVQVPSHEGLNGLFDAIIATMTRLQAERTMDYGTSS